MSWQTDFKFTVDKPEPSGWAIPAVSPWGKPPEVVHAYQTDENLKKLFGIELAKSINAFEAGCKIFGEETNKALWASVHWNNDPLVIASKDIYLKTLEMNRPLLDREQLAAKALAIADEKILKNGVWYPTVEAKDRIAALKLYSDIAGYTGKVEIDNSKTTNTFNEMTIKLVKADDKKANTIENAPNVKSEMSNENLPPITLKLVGGSSR